MTGAQAVVETLRREGVRYVFGLPGTTVLDIFDTIHRESATELIVVRHEQAAAFMADGYARASGRVGVCLASRGPGAANLAIGLHTAYQESSSVVALVGQVGTDIVHREAFEEMDLVSFFAPVTKWSVEIPRADRIPELLQRALRVSPAGRPRPVMVSIPADLQSASADMHFTAGKPPSLPRGDPAEIERAAELLLCAERPVVIAGGGVIGSRATSELVQLAEALSLPVVTAWYRNDAFPNDHPLYMGSLGPWGTRPSKRVVADADAVMAVGCRLGEFTTDRYTLLSPDTKIIQVDIDPLEIGRVFPAEVAIVADARSALIDLAQALASQRQGKSQDRPGRPWFESHRRGFAMSRLPPAVNAGRPAEIAPVGLVAALNEVLDRDAILALDAGNFAAWISRYYHFLRAGSLVGVAGGSMGFGLPAALGAKLAQPDRAVVAMTGDGCFMMTLQALDTAVRYGIRVVTVVMNNSAYGNVKEKQQRLYGGRIVGSDLSNPDFAQVAELFGAYGESVTRSEQIVPALRRALAMDRPAVLDVLVDPRQLCPPTD